MKPTQTVTNISNQLPTYCYKGTNILGHVSNISWNTRFEFFIKSLFFYGLLKFKIHKQERLVENNANTKKLPTYCNKGTNILGLVSNIS